MNQYISSTFDHIMREESNYRGAVKNALEDYRSTMARATVESKQYKNENSFVAEKKAAARRAAQLDIASAWNYFSGILKAETESLRDDLHKHLTTRPSPAFLDALRIYHDFDLAPSRSEVEALMELNGGCPLGYRALSRVLETTGAEWRIDAPAASDYESDLATLEKLGNGNIRFVPDGYLHEMVGVYGGEKRLFTRDDGSTYDAGYKWDSTSLLMSSASYKEQTESIDAMAARWSSTVLPSLKHITAYQDNPETGETADQQMAQGMKDTARTPEIKEDRQSINVETARARARARAENDARSAAAVEKITLKG